MDASDSASLPRAASSRAINPEIHAVTRLIRLDQGLFALGIGPVATETPANSGMTLPCVQISSPPSSELDAVEIFGVWNGHDTWIDADGGTVVLRVPAGGGQVLATLYGGPGTGRPQLDDISILRLDQFHTPAVRKPGVSLPPPPPEAPALLTTAFADADDTFMLAETSEAAADPDAIALEITLHMERLGDMMFGANAWCGRIGARMQIEAFAMRGTSLGMPLQLEYMAFGPAGRQTRWMADGQLCGTRGRGIPLTGFAVRLAPAMAQSFDVTYQGSFFASGATLPCRNGAVCLPPGPEDYLEAMHVAVTPRET